MTAHPPVAALALIVLASTAHAQPATVELQHSAGASSESTSGASTQIKFFGEPLRGLRFTVEGSFGQQHGEESDLLSTAYPYGGRMDLIDAYAEYFVRPGLPVRSVRVGRYRTPFGISSASEHAYLGFTRPPLIRYGEYFALSSGYLEHGVDVVVGTSRLSAELSLGRPADVGEAIRAPGFDTVARIEGTLGAFILGTSVIDTTPYLPPTFARGRSRFGGVDMRWMHGGVQLRGEWLHGQPFAGVSTTGGYMDVIVHRPAMGPVTLVGRAERLDYDTTPRFALHTHRYQAGLRVRVWQGLSVSIGTSHQLGQLTQNRPSVVDVGVTYALRTAR